MWRRCVPGPREPMRTLGWRLHGKRSGMMACDEPTHIVGLGESIGAVTQELKRAPLFIRIFFDYFLRVGLCSHLISKIQDTWQHGMRWIKSTLKSAC